MLNEFNKDRFLQYYGYEFNNSGELIIFKKENPKLKKFIPKNNRAFTMLTYEHNVKAMRDAQKLYEEGKADNVTARELYKELGNYTDEQVDDLFTGMYKKDREYIKRLEEEIGFIEEVIDEEYAPSMEKVGKIQRDIFHESDVFKCDDGRYAIRYGVRGAIDDYSDITIYTSCYPVDDFFKRLSFIEDETDRLQLEYIDSKRK